MNTFQLIVIITALCLLIISLLVIGFIMYKSKFNKKYPPVVADCPDYWIDESDGDTSKCVNVKKLGNGSCPTTMNFSQSIWQGNTGLCNKYKWAKKCNLTWDGVTNANEPCSNEDDN